MGYAGKYVVALLLWGCLGGGACWFLCRRDRRRGGKTLLAAYLTGLLSQLVLPRVYVWSERLSGQIHYYVSVSVPEAGARMWNLVPFRTLAAQVTGDLPLGADSGAIGLLNLLANTVLWLPLGFLPPLVSPRFRSWKRVLALGVGLSAGVEVIQYFIGRSADIDDFLLNVAAALAGHGLYRFCRRMGLSD